MNNSKRSDQMHKILFLHAGSELYGADKILLEIIENLDTTKYSVQVLLPNEGPLTKKMQEAGIAVDTMPYPILRRKYFNALGMINYLFRYIYYSIKLIHFVKRNKIDIVHVNTTAVLEGVAIKVFTNSRIVWHVHEIIVSPKVVFKFVSWLVARFSDSVVAVSEATKNRLVESGYFGSDDVNLIRNGIKPIQKVSDVEMQNLRKKLEIPESGIVFGMVGRVNAWKGQPDFVRAFEKASQQNDSLFAIMVGGVFAGEDFRMEALRRQISDSGLDNRIRVVDFTENVGRFYSIFDIFVMPSTRPDPFPTVVLEAMSVGLPVVGYNHGGVTEMVEDGKNGFLSEAGNIDKLAENFTFLASRESVRRSFGVASADLMNREFNLASFIQKIEMVYGRL